MTRSSDGLKRKEKKRNVKKRQTKGKEEEKGNTLCNQHSFGLVQGFQQ